ncbi:MAG: thiamine phosphate synthase [Nibricoccus sp.]
MKLAVISPEGYEPREHAVLAALFAAGLERYHVRKPQWTEHVLRNFVRLVPEKWRARLVLHQYHALAEEFGCGGVHFKDSEGKVRPPGVPRFSDGHAAQPWVSRSCHTLATLSSAVGCFDSVFFSPVFPSISKPGYEPATAVNEVADFLAGRTDSQRQTTVFALGGVTPGNAARCADLGFDGVAVLGALWQASEPLKVFEQLQHALSAHAA